MSLAKNASDIFYHGKAKSIAVSSLGHLYFALDLLESLDFLSCQIEYLAVCRAPVVFGYIVQLVVKLGVDFYSEVLVFLISHKKSPKNLIISIF